MSGQAASGWRGGDRIALKGLRVKGFHGVLDHERHDGQEFVVDAVVQVDTRTAAASDDLADTVDYGSLALALAEIVRGEPVLLIERLAERLAQRCLDDERVQEAQVTVHKPSAPIPEEFADVAVTVRRRRALSPSGVVAVLALGANLGDRQARLQAAVDALAALAGVRVLAVSPVVETAPVGGAGAGRLPQRRRAGEQRASRGASAGRVPRHRGGAGPPA